MTVLTTLTRISIFSTFSSLLFPTCFGFKGLRSLKVDFASGGFIRKIKVEVDFQGEIVS